MTHIGRVE